MLRIEGLEVRKGNFILQVDHFEVQTHEFISILGPSGSGKTTFLEAIAGFSPLKKGKILFYGNDITELPPWERNVAIIYQEAYLFPHLTVWKNLLYGKKACADFVRNIAGKLKISDLLDRFPNELSAGQRQRVSIARAIATRPLILLMDEPFNFLDPINKEDFRSLVKEIRESFLMPMILVTHDLEEALYYADRVAIIREGKIVGVDTPYSLVKRPEDDFVAQFTGRANFLPIEKKGERYFLGSVEINLPERVNRDRFVVMIRPQDIIISDAEPQHSSARNHLKGRIVEVRPGSKVNEVKVEVNGITLVVFITDASREELNLQPGMEVYLVFKATALHIFD